jgi:Rrf2 family protein
MPSPFRMSEAAALALHAATLLAAESRADGRTLAARQIALALGASEAHLSKVLQRLARAGLVTSTRGPRGGFRLGRPAREITLLQVYEAIEGPLGAPDCLFGRPVCAGSGCICGDLLSDVHKRTRRRLAGTRLSQLGGIFAGTPA